MEGLYRSLGAERVCRPCEGERAWHVDATARILHVWNRVNNGTPIGEAFGKAKKRLSHREP